MTLIGRRFSLKDSDSENQRAILIFHRYNGPIDSVAQSAEQGTFNPKVLGSIPNGVIGDRRGRVLRSRLLFGC